VTSIGCPGFTSQQTRRQRTARGLYDVRDARRAASHERDHGIAIRDDLTDLGSMWSALAVGYAVIGLDGQVYLTDAGAEYLAWVDA
jgi:hypothetical protein